jgi:hypothetical protein
MNTFLWEVNPNQIWIEIPKNGSYNLKTFLYHYNSELPVETQPHCKINKITKIDLNKHEDGFVIIRNPIERFKSLVSHYFFHGGRFSKGFGSNWMNLIGVKNYTLQNISNIILENISEIDKIQDPHHFNSQSSFIPIDFFSLKTFNVYDVNEMTKIFGLKENINSSNSSLIELDSYSISKLQELYEMDFILHEKYILSK